MGKGYQFKTARDDLRLDHLTGDIGFEVLAEFGTILGGSDDGIALIGLVDDLLTQDRVHDL